MNYRHLSSSELIERLDQKTLSNASKVICVGRNYAAHAEELNNPIPEAPMFFIKPNSALVNWGKQLTIPIDRGECHHELELAVLLGQKLTHATYEQTCRAVVGVTLGLDLTLRDLQNQLKAKGYPWEIAKAFDDSCPIAEWQSVPDSTWLERVDIELTVNGDVRQTTNTRLMLWPVIELIRSASRHFSLSPGDIIMTGTPAGVGKLCVGDKLVATMNHQLIAQSEVAAVSGNHYE